MVVNVKLISSQLLSLAAISLTFMNVLAAIALYDRHVVAENSFFLGVLALSTFVIVGGASWLLWTRAYENSKPDTEDLSLQTDKDTRMDDALKEQREEMQKSIDEVAQSADALKAENTDLAQRLGEESKLREEESSRATDSHNALERAQQSLAAAQQHSEALTREREALQGTVVDLEESTEKLAEVSQSNETLESSLRDMKETCDELRESVHSIMEEKNALEIQVEELSNAEEEAEADTAEVSVSLLTQQESYASLIESMTREIETHTTEKEALDATLSEHTEKIEELKSTVNEKTELSERLQKSLDDKVVAEKMLKSRNKALTKGDNAAAKSVHELQTKISSLEADLVEQSKADVELKSELSHKIDTELQLTKTLELSRAEVKSLQGRLLCETQSGGALKYEIAVKEETELTVTRDLERAHSKIADLEQKLEHESSQRAEVDSQLLALKKENAHVADLLRKCEERNSNLEEDLKELRDATQSQGAMGDQVKFALSTLQRRVTNTLMLPPLDRHTSAPALSPVRETVERTDSIAPSTPRSPQKMLFSQRHGSVETPKNTPRKVSSSFSDGTHRSPGDFTILLKNKARLRRSLALRVPATPAHRRSLTRLFRTERSWSVPRARSRATSRSAPNSPVFGPSAHGPLRSLTPAPLTRAFSDPMSSEIRESLRAPRSPKSEEVAVRLFTSACDDAQASLFDFSDSARSEAMKSPRNVGKCSFDASEVVPKSTYDKLNTRYEALSLQVNQLCQRSPWQVSKEGSVPSFDGDRCRGPKMQIAPLKRGSIASQSGDLCNIDEVLRSPVSALSSRQPSPMRLSSDRSEMLARDLAEARRTILDLQKRLSDLNASNLEIREVSAASRSGLSREVDTLRAQLVEENKKVAEIAESRHETEQRLKKITTLARALKTENTTLTQRVSVEVAALRAELGEREVTKLLLQHLLDEFAASEVHRKREARARVLAAGARFQSINTDTSKRTPETPRSAPATLSLLDDTPQKDPEGCGRGEGEMTAGNTPQKVDMHRSLILSDGDDPAKDLFGDDDSENAGDSPWKIEQSHTEGNDETEAEFEENASDTFSPANLARARHNRLFGRVAAAARRPSLASVASCPELPVASPELMGHHIDNLSESGEAGANQPPYKVPETPLRLKSDGGGGGGGGDNQCTIIQQLIAKFRKLCERLLQANDKLQEYESQRIETQCEMEALRDSSQHQVEQLRARVATIEKAYEQSIGEISQLRMAYRGAEAQRKQNESDLSKLQRQTRNRSASCTSTPRTPLPSPTDPEASSAARTETEVTPPARASAASSSSTSKKRSSKVGRGSANLNRKTATSLISPSTTSKLVRPRATSFSTSTSKSKGERLNPSRSQTSLKSRPVSRLRTTSVDESRVSSKEKRSSSDVNGELIGKLTTEKGALERENNELHERVMKSDERAADFEMEREKLKMKHDADKRRLKEANAKIKQLRENIFHLEELEIVHIDKIEELEADISVARNLSHEDSLKSDADESTLGQRTQNASFESNLIDSSFNSSFNDSFGDQGSAGQTHLSSATQRQTLGNPEYSDLSRDTSSFPVVVPDNEGYSANTSSCVKNLSFSSVTEDETPDVPSRAHISLLSTPETSYSREHSDHVRSEHFADPKGSSRANSAIPKNNSALSIDVNTSVTQSERDTTRRTEPKFPSPSSLNIENLRSLTEDDLAPLPRFRVQTPPRSLHRRVHSYAAPASAPRRQSSMHRIRAAQTHANAAASDLSALTRTPGRPFASRAHEGRSHGLGLSHSRTHSSMNASAAMQLPQRALFHSHISPKDVSLALAAEGVNVPLAQSSFAGPVPHENRGDESSYSPKFSPLANYRTL